MGAADQPIEQRLRAALEKFTKWRSVFAGWQLGTRSNEDAESRAVRDHRELTMLLRAEQNAMLQLMVAKGVFTLPEWHEQLLAEVQHLDKAYEKKFPGYRTIPEGVEIYSIPLAQDTMRGWRP